MRVVARCLKPGGLFLLHTIGGNVSTHSCDPWIEKYIFPNGMLPSIAQIARATEGVFVMGATTRVSLATPRPSTKAIFISSGTDNSAGAAW